MATNESNVSILKNFIFKIAEQAYITNDSFNSVKAGIVQESLNGKYTVLLDNSTTPIDATLFYSNEKIKKNDYVYLIEAYANKNSNFIKYYIFGKVGDVQKEIGKSDWSRFITDKIVGEEIPQTQMNWSSIYNKEDKYKIIVNNSSNVMILSLLRDIVEAELTTAPEGFKYLSKTFLNTLNSNSIVTIKAGDYRLRPIDESEVLDVSNLYKIDTLIIESNTEDMYFAPTRLGLDPKNIICCEGVKVEVGSLEYTDDYARQLKNICCETGARFLPNIGSGNNKLESLPILMQDTDWKYKEKYYFSFDSQANKNFINSINEQGHFAIYGDFSCTTELKEYGLTITLKFEDGQPFIYKFSSQDFIGQPFNTDTAITQKKIFKIPKKITELAIQGFAFNKDGTTNSSANIGLSNLTIAAGSLYMLDSGMEVEVAAAANSRPYFSKFVDNENVTLHAEITQNGQTVFSDLINYIWYINDSDKQETDEDYWICLHEPETLTLTDLAGNSITVPSIGSKASNLNLYRGTRPIVSESESIDNHFCDIDNFIIESEYNFDKDIKKDDEKEFSIDLLTYNNHSFVNNSNFKAEILKVIVTTESDGVSTDTVYTSGWDSVCTITEDGHFISVELPDTAKHINITFTVKGNKAFFDKKIKCEIAYEGISVESNVYDLWDYKYETYDLRIDSNITPITFYPGDDIDNPIELTAVVIGGLKQTNSKHKFKFQWTLEGDDEEIFKVQEQDDSSVSEIKVSDFVNNDRTLALWLSQGTYAKESNFINKYVIKDTVTLKCTLFVDDLTEIMAEKTQEVKVRSDSDTIEEVHYQYYNYSDPPTIKINKYNDITVLTSGTHRYDLFEEETDLINNLNISLVIDSVTITYDDGILIEYSDNNWDSDFCSIIKTINSTGVEYEQYYIQSIFPEEPIEGKTITQIKINYHVSGDDKDGVYFEEVEAPWSNWGKVTFEKAFRKNNDVIDPVWYGEWSIKDDNNPGAAWRLNANLASISSKCLNESITESTVEFLYEDTYHEGLTNDEALRYLQSLPIAPNEALYYTSRKVWIEKQDGEAKRVGRQEEWAYPQILKAAKGDGKNLVQGAIDKINTFNSLTDGGRDQGMFFEDVYILTKDKTAQKGKKYYKKQYDEVKGSFTYPEQDKISEGDDLTAQFLYELKKDQVYINAEYIQTGALRVGDSDGHIFYADIDQKEVEIGGFTVDNTTIRTNNYRVDGNPYLKSDNYDGEEKIYRNESEKRLELGKGIKIEEPMPEYVMVGWTNNLNIKYKDTDIAFLPDGYTIFGNAALSEDNAWVKTIVFPESYTTINKLYLEHFTKLKTIVFFGSLQYRPASDEEINWLASHSIKIFYDSSRDSRDEDKLNEIKESFGEKTQFFDLKNGDWSWQTDITGFALSANSKNNMIDSQFFKVTQEGSIYATEGFIGGFEIGENALRTSGYEYIRHEEESALASTDYYDPSSLIYIAPSSIKITEEVTDRADPYTKYYYGLYTVTMTIDYSEFSISNRDGQECKDITIKQWDALRGEFGTTMDYIEWSSDIQIEKISLNEPYKSRKLKITRTGSGKNTNQDFLTGVSGLNLKIFLNFPVADFATQENGFQISGADKTYLIHSKHFKVSPDGLTTLTEGKVGGWHLDNFKLYSDTLVMDKDFSTKGYGYSQKGAGIAASSWEGDPCFWAGYMGAGRNPWEGTEYEKKWAEATKFYVTNTGKVVARDIDICGNGTIGSLKINQDGLFVQNKDARDTFILNNNNLAVPLINNDFMVKIGNISFIASEIGGSSSQNLTTLQIGGPFSIAALDESGEAVSTSITFGTDDNGEKDDDATVTLYIVHNSYTDTFWDNTCSLCFYAVSTAKLHQTHTFTCEVDVASVNIFGGYFETPFKESKTLSVSISAGQTTSNKDYFYMNHHMAGTRRTVRYRWTSEGSWNYIPNMKDAYTYTKTQKVEQKHYTNNIIITGNIVPSAGKSYNLGEADRCWDIVYTKDGTVESSDRNQKNSIEPLAPQYDILFDELNPVRYKFNQNDSNRYHIGFISQDVKEALSIANIPTSDFAGYILYDKNDETKGCGLRYGEFIALNTDQIQKLKKRESELENKVAQLELQIKEIKGEI